MAHLGGGDRGMLAKLGAKGSVSAAQRMDRDPLGQRWPILSGQQFVSPSRMAP
jgi:hypothetical protein